MQLPLLSLAQVHLLLQCFSPNPPNSTDFASLKVASPDPRLDACPAPGEYSFPIGGCPSIQSAMENVKMMTGDAIEVVDKLLERETSGTQDGAGEKAMWMTKAMFKDIFKIKQEDGEEVDEEYKGMLEQVKLRLHALSLLSPPTTAPPGSPHVQIYCFEPGFSPIKAGYFNGNNPKPENPWHGAWLEGSKKCDDHEINAFTFYNSNAGYTKDPVLMEKMATGQEALQSLRESGMSYLIENPEESKFESGGWVDGKLVLGQEFLEKLESYEETVLDVEEDPKQPQYAEKDAIDGGASKWAKSGVTIQVCSDAVDVPSLFPKHDNPEFDQTSEMPLSYRVGAAIERLSAHKKGVSNRTPSGPQPAAETIILEQLLGTQWGLYSHIDAGPGKEVQDIQKLKLWIMAGSTLAGRLIW